MYLAGILIKVGGINLLGFHIPGALGCGLCGLREWRLSQPPAVKKAWRSDWRVRWRPLGTAGWEIWRNMMKHVLPSPETRACNAAGIPARFCILLSSCRSVPFAKLRCSLDFEMSVPQMSFHVVPCRFRFLWLQQRTGKNRRPYTWSVETMQRSFGRWSNCPPWTVIPLFFLAMASGRTETRDLVRI